MNNFEDELQALINKYSKENESNTPDFILAEFLMRCLNLWDDTVKKRAYWYSRMDIPGRGSVPYPEENEDAS